MWYPDSIMRIIGADSIITTLGSSHKYIKNMVFRLFGPENLRRDMIKDMQKTAEASLLSWLHHPSIELKEAASSVCLIDTFDLELTQADRFKLTRGRKNVMKMLKEMMDERKKATGRQESIDFFDVLLEELKEEKHAMSENVALDLIFLLLFVSFETTASGITAILCFLSDNPKALQELTEEHDYIQKKRPDLNSEITWEEYKSMKFTSHVIHEALRLTNIAPVMFRKATEDVHIKVEVCTTVQDTAEPAGGASKDFMAFGGGRRLCVGADFAKLQMAIFLHCLVTKYRWKVIKGGKMVLCPGLQCPEGFHIQLLPKG
uniref:Cytochrome P450 family protein n=1 Tax=Oryza sativa subsp. japonica TaxID=39947 RepID=Q2QTQ9_ORYSJ|nr:Cytochrome P450 family protein [Oryza sativa Japonica Group]